MNICWPQGGIVTYFLKSFTLFVRISTEDCESWDMECLRTPLGGPAKDGDKDGERGGDMHKGGPPS